MAKIIPDDDDAPSQKSPLPSPAATFLKKRDAWLRGVANDTSLAHPTVRVALHIAMRMNGKKQSGAWPSVKTISEQTGVSVRGVLYAIDELCGKNRESGKWDGVRYVTADRKRNAGNRYWLNFFWE